jgi:ABC-type antimicrobial peptide transport system permease subunit
MAEILAPELRPWRLGATLFSLLGGLALLVAAVGVYSTVAYDTSRRRHEFGVRTALGARPSHLLRLVLGQGVRAATVGIIVGAGLALGTSRLVASLLYGVSPRDPAVLAGVGATLLAAALLASLAPAWRAARVSPIDALRDE